MHLPINVAGLIQSSLVESDRIEFKAQWNPEAILRTMCAFANDFHNFGGGYIVIGVSESNGRPILPPEGIDINEADKFQKDLLRLSSFLKPSYIPIVSFEKFNDKHLMIIWVPGGHERPYSAPDSLGKHKEYKHYIRNLSSTVIAKHDILKELIELTATVPFDDRINHKHGLEDLRLSLIQSFLHDVGSGLLQESRTIPFVELCKQMALIDGGNELLKPRNVALLFFNDQPEKIFHYAQIEVVYFPDDEEGDLIQEEIFKGPLDHQLRSALRHIQNNFISERIIKLPDRAEARRFFNYPYIAIEEALVNAVYHRSYQIREPIEVRINRSSITVVSHPGPDPSISDEDLKSGRMISKRYRNRRIGEFLKELDFIEGRHTGVPKMRNALKHNGSPEPTFNTDAVRASFWTEIRVHPEFLIDITPKPCVQVEASDQASDQASDRIFINDSELKILQLSMQHSVGRSELLEAFGHTTMSGNLKQAIRHLRECGLIELTIKDKPNSKNQRYKITRLGIDVLSKVKSFANADS